MNERAQGDRLVALVTELLEQLDGTAVTECEFRAGTHHILIRRTPVAVSAVARITAEEETIPDHWQAITSPLSGIFYAADNPSTPPFVAVGAVVTIGQVVGLIESMKMFNRVESDRNGVVRAVVVQNGDEIAAGQPLVYIEPLGDAS